jgi:hypothetical protein
MNARKWIVGVLIVFVVVSVAWMVYTETRKGGESPGDAAVIVPDQEGRYVIAYYFHGDKRCVTCLTIEEYAAEAIATGFAERIDNGDMIWQVVNVDATGNEHFIEDYMLASKTVVLVEVVDGEETKWEQLNKVWELVDDKEAFVDYVQESTAEFAGI